MNGSKEKSKPMSSIQDANGKIQDRIKIFFNQ